MKRIITLGIALVMMLVSLGGCFIPYPVGDYDRGGRHDWDGDRRHDWGERHDWDGNRGHDWGERHDRW